MDQTRKAMAEILHRGEICASQRALYSQENKFCIEW